MRKLIYILAFVSNFVVATVYASDWRYFGNSGGKDDSAMFYDADTIEHPNKDSIRVWTKLIPQESLTKYVDKHHADKQIIDGVAKKLVNGYIPEYLELPSIKKRYSMTVSTKEELADIKVNVVLSEFLANSGNVQESAKIFSEIQCVQKQIGTLSIITYKKDGSSSSEDFQIPMFIKHVAPDTSGEWLLFMVCPKS
jgi:hypothetical protein